MGSRHGRACGEQLASPTLSEPVAFSVTPERRPLPPKCVGSMPPWRPNSMGTSGSGAARIPRSVRGGGFWATRGSRRRRSTELTNPVSRRRFVPSNVPPVPQLAANTERANGLLSRGSGVRFPPGAPAFSRTSVVLFREPAPELSGFCPGSRRAPACAIRGEGHHRRLGRQGRHELGQLRGGLPGNLSGYGPLSVAFARLWEEISEIRAR